MTTPTPPPAEGRGSWSPGAGDRLMEVSRCIAISKQSRQQCRKPPVPGLRVCHVHGGGTTAARAKAVQNRAEAEARAQLGIIWDLDAAPVSNPVTALLTLAGRLENAVNILGARLETESDLDNPTAVAWVRVLTEQRKALEGIERLDLTARQVQLEEAQAAQVTAAVRLGLAAAELDEQQTEAFVTAFLGALGRGASAGTTVVAGEVGS